MDIEYPYFLLFYFCKQFTAITGHNKQMSVALITASTKMWMTLLHNSRNVLWISYVQCDYSCQQRDKFVYKKNNSHFPFLRIFIAMNVGLEIFIEIHVFLYFYNETTSSHQRCSTEKLFLKILQYLQENTCVAVTF